MRDAHHDGERRARRPGEQLHVKAAVLPHAAQRGAHEAASERPAAAAGSDEQRDMRERQREGGVVGCAHHGRKRHVRRRQSVEAEEHDEGDDHRRDQAAVVHARRAQPVLVLGHRDAGFPKVPGVERGDQDAAQAVGAAHDVLRQRRSHHMVAQLAKTGPEPDPHVKLWHDLLELAHQPHRSIPHVRRRHGSPGSPGSPPRAR